MFKCPYCQQDSYAKSSKKKGKFESWKAVKGHSSYCVKSTGEYFIDTNEGPIHFNEVLNITNIDFKYKYKNLCTKISNIRRSFKQRNFDTGIHFNHITKDLIIKAIKDFYITYNKIPCYRDFNFQYSSAINGVSNMSIKRYFGSFNEAIKAAGFEPDYNDGYGTRTIAKDGILYRSKAEAYFVDNYLYNKHEYVYEPKYQNHTRWYDFYLPNLDLYIEINGGLRPQVIQEKIQINKEENKNLRIISITELYKKDFIL